MGRAGLEGAFAWDAAGVSKSKVRGTERGCVGELPLAPGVESLIAGPFSDDLRAAVIFWSSGTSGKSKGVVLTHKALASAIISVWYGAGLGADERLIGLPPL